MDRLGRDYVVIVGFFGDSDRSGVAAEGEEVDGIREGEDVVVGVVLGGEALGVTWSGADTWELCVKLPFLLLLTFCFLWRR